MENLLKEAFPSKWKCLLGFLGGYTLDNIDNAAAQVGHVCNEDIYTVISRIREVSVAPPRPKTARKSKSKKDDEVKDNEQ